MRAKASLASTLFTATQARVGDYQTWLDRSNCRLERQDTPSSGEALVG
jgi:hypothetical protein